MNVTKAFDEKLGRVKTPKSKAGVRVVPIESELVPLLSELRKAANGKGPVVARMPPMEDWSEKLRRHLRRAGIERAELFDTTPTVKRITLHDLRSTGITWRCLRKDYGPEIQQAAGHEKYDTTDGYIRTARVYQGRVGEPFPPLPESVIKVSEESFDDDTETPNATMPPDDSALANRPEASRFLVSSCSHSGSVATPAGIEPALPA